METILSWSGVLLLMAATPGRAADRPNFVVILGEAQGWASMSEPQDDRHVEGSKSDFISTPNLDRLARAGVRFSDFYAASPRCTPTRAALVTGKSPAALHMTFVNEGRGGNPVLPGDKVVPPTATTDLPRDAETLGGILKRAGYATAHFGKWHLGRVNPRFFGYDENDGPNGNEGPDGVENPNPKQCHAIAKLGMEFMERQVHAQRSFYLQLSQYPGRGAAPASAEKMEAVRQRLGTRLEFQRIAMAACDEEIDQTIGEVLAKLKELGAMENTYVIYTADHGAQGRRANGMLTMGKGTVWEGGLRVPLLVAGPGIRAGTFVHGRASTVDLMPTVVQLAGLKAEALPKDLEGGSLVEVLKNGDGAVIHRPHEELVIHFPHYDNDPLGPASAILWHDYKWIHAYETGAGRLFDLKNDLGEQRDLTVSKPELAADLERRIGEYLTQVHAGIPRANPSYDPNGPKSIDRKGGGGRKGGGN